MFQKQTVKAFSIVAIVLSAIGLLFSIAGTLLIQGSGSTAAFIFGIITWVILLWSAIIGYQLSSNYPLEAEQYQKVGIRVYAIIVAFILFFFVGLVVGLIISIAIFGALWALKSNYDDWKNSEPDPVVPADPIDKSNDAANS